MEEMLRRDQKKKAKVMGDKMWWTHLRFRALHAFISPDKMPNFRNNSTEPGASL